MNYGGHSMVAPLRRVIVKKPEDAFLNEEAIGAQWKSLAYLAPPDLKLASREHQNFVEVLKRAGAEVLYLPADSRTGLDSLYAHDPAMVTDAGVIIFQMGKPARRGEGPALADALENWDVPVLGRLEDDEYAEGGDMTWLDHQTLIAGRTFRTNERGIAKIRSLVEHYGINVIDVDLPYWNGPEEVFHLMSIISLVDENLAVVYRPLLPVSLFELLQSRDIQMIELSREEYDQLGCNILTLAPRNVLMIRGNPKIQNALERAGCTVQVCDGEEISKKGSGGPTCLARPLLRSC
jgi:N-dimethylarginine dimethylaminohydrolase